jgi:hypothetical protein
VPEKYNLDNELEVAKDIDSLRMESWDPVVDQAVILKTKDNDLYLVVMQQPMR